MLDDILNKVYFLKKYSQKKYIIVKPIIDPLFRLKLKIIYKVFCLIEFT